MPIHSLNVQEYIDTDRDAIVGCFLPLYILMALFGFQLLVVCFFFFIYFIVFLFNPKFLHVDELEFVVYLLFFGLYLFVTSVGLVFSQGVPHVADKKELSAPLATEPQAGSR